MDPEGELREDRESRRGRFAHDGTGAHPILRRPTMKLRTHHLAPIALALLVSACASTQSGNAPTNVADGVLTGKNGMTLYTFDRDTTGTGKSVCNGPCATNWPPLAATDGSLSGDYSVITRDDGSKQVAYKGKPLYYWVKDTKPGDKTGDGFNNVWRVAKP
jgi:predicted lipoprotein with Yx(FWY)xxD motif